MEESATQKTQEVKTRRLVDVQFSTADKEHSFDAGEHKLFIHDLAVVEGDKGPIIGRITTPVYEKRIEEVPTNIRKVLRKANEEDIERFEKNREEAMRAFNLCQEKIGIHSLSMKLVDVDILAGDAKAIFYFTAEERVDFRALVKDLATALHMRIEMRQIGARDAAKSIGSIASCGLVCCCKTHLKEFRSIAIQMAKNQGLSPNPSKLTGMCGKLKCCLLYENAMYLELKKGLPSIGSEVKTPMGEGVVTGVDIPRRLVSVRSAGSAKDTRFKVEDIEIAKKKERKKRQFKKKE